MGEVADIRTMEEAKLRLLVEENHKPAFRWALHCCNGNWEESEEVLQTVYLKVLEGRARFEGKSTFKTWLFGVIRITAKGRRYRLTHYLKRFSEVATDVRSGGEDPAHELRRSELREGILALLASLSARQREVLQLVFYHELTIEEAAAILRISVGSARTHYERGKQRLRQEMVRTGFNYEEGSQGLRDRAAV